MEHDEKMMIKKVIMVKNKLMKTMMMNKMKMVAWQFS